MKIHRLTAARAILFLKNGKRYGFRWNEFTPMGGLSPQKTWITNPSGEVDQTGHIYEYLKKPEGHVRVIGTVYARDVPKVVKFLGRNFDGSKL